MMPRLYLARAPKAQPGEGPGEGLVALAGLPVIITVLAFNFFGDGLRDAADPYE